MVRFRLGEKMKPLLDGAKLLTQMAINDSEQSDPNRPPGDVQLMVMVMVVQKVGDQAILEMASSNPDATMNLRMLGRATQQLMQQVKEDEHGKH
jgi:hypothetical protein